MKILYKSSWMDEWYETSISRMVRDRLLTEKEEGFYSRSKNDLDKATERIESLANTCGVLCEILVSKGLMTFEDAKSLGNYDNIEYKEEN